ncbi:hypothetical protein Syun_008395 [Stephania yunnanensis]|uniref:Transcription factor TFIIIC triple barrel domain-containing protein n=1 Tax=Stephania yunnanensis TaxID=152371 RepID=A0AAP0PRB4_9MAGN
MERLIDEKVEIESFSVPIFGKFAPKIGRKVRVYEGNSIPPPEREISTAEENESVEEEEEYVLLDLDDVRAEVNIPPNAPYVLSGLDTLNPTLVIGNNLKLIGEYEETVGTCYVFTEAGSLTDCILSDDAPVLHEETGPSEANLFKGKCIVDPNQTSAKQVRPIASLQKVIKFRFFSEADKQGEAAESERNL